MKHERLLVYLKLRNYVGENKKVFITLIVISGIAVPLALVSPYMMKILIDTVMLKHEFGIFKFIAAGLLSVFAIKTLLDTINLYCSNRLLNSFSFAIRADIWKVYMRMPLSIFEKKNAADLKMRYWDDVETIGNFLKDQVVDYHLNIISAVVAFISTFMFNPVMPLLCIPIIPIVFYINHKIASGERKVKEVIRQNEQSYYSFEHNAFQFWKEIKAHNIEDSMIKRFMDYRTLFSKLGMRWIRYYFYNEVFSDFKLNYLTKVLAYLIGSIFVIKGKLTVGSLIAFGEYFTILFTAIDNVNMKNNSLKTTTPFYNRVFETLEFDQEKVRTEKENFASIQLNDVTFSYIGRNTPAVKNVNMDIKKGEHIAIVGKSGCGKTTLAKLILGVYSPQSGSIIFNGKFTMDNSVSYLNIGAVMQDCFMFNATIRENLCLAKKDATEEDLILACQKIGIYTYIQEQKDGFDTIIGERGIKLSGGQKQKIAIAQVILQNPQVLILDEATSSMDSVSESIVNSAINSLSDDITVIIISHKPSTLTRVDKIFVMTEGTITDYGTQKEMRERNDFYKKITERAVV